MVNLGETHVRETLTSMCWLYRLIPLSVAFYQSYTNLEGAHKANVSSTRFVCAVLCQLKVSATRACLIMSGLTPRIQLGEHKEFVNAYIYNINTES